MAQRPQHTAFDGRFDEGGAMSWEAIGAIGSLISGVGVIVTLVYLARQIQQNSGELAAQSRFNFYQTRVSMGLVPLADPELMSAGVKSQTGEELDALEAQKLQVISRALFVAWEYEVGEVKHGRLALEEFNVAEKHRMMQAPFLQAAWQRVRETAPSSFVEFMEQQVIGRRG
jgi:hypothetical protein